MSKKDNVLMNSSTNMNINVRLAMRDINTGEILHTVEGHNRVTKMAVMGLIRFCNGEFNDTTPLRILNYIPRYLALGSNIAGTINPGVSAEVTINDSKLLSEISPRIKLTQRNIENRYTNPYAKLIMKVFVPVDQFIGERIGEAGLFTDKMGNNCWARITFEPFVKEANTVIDVTWEITIVSMESSNQPYEKIDKEVLQISIDNALNKISKSNDTYKNICNELIIAYKMYADNSATQNEINNEATKLNKINVPNTISSKEYNTAVVTAKDIEGKIK